MNGKQKRKPKGSPRELPDAAKRSSPPPQTGRPRLSARKKAVFAAITLAGFFGLLELLLAVAGFQPVLYEEDPYVGFASSLPLFVEEQAENGEVYLTTAPYKTRWFNQQRFPKEKPPGTYRIFSLGGSTTYGRPYADELSFSGWLRELLPLADPSRNWEVINAGGISYASYRVSVVMEELLGYEPDLFLIYTGHNEFLEERTYGELMEAPRLWTALGGLAIRTRIYAAGRQLVNTLDESGTGSRAVLGSEVDTMLEHSVGPEDYRRDDRLRGQVFGHFQLNLNRMIDMARSANAKVVLITPASNMKDCSPFKSEPTAGLEAGAAEQFDRLMSAAATAQAKADWERVVDLLQRAQAIDGRYAELHYGLGLALYQLGRFEEARSAFVRAIEEDVCPLRASRQISAMIAETAAEREVPLVDFAKVLRERSKHGITDKEYFLDHVHLNAQGYRLLALQVIEALDREDFLRLAETWNEKTLAAATERVMERLDDKAYGKSLRNLAKVFDWAGKHEEAERLAKEAAEVLGEDAETYLVLGHAAASRGEDEAAIKYFEQAVRVQPDLAEAHYGLGTKLHSLGRHRRAIEHFRRALEITPDSDGDVHYNLGLSLHALAQFEQAVREFRRSLRIDPARFDAHHNLAVALLAQGRPSEAIDHLQTAIALRPDSEESHFNLGVALVANGDAERAVACYREAIRLRPSYPEAHNNLGMTLLLLNQSQEAKKSLSRAIEIRPDYAEAHDNLGSALMILGEEREALRHFERAIQLRRNWFPPLQHLAWLLATSSDAQIRDGKRAVRLAEQAASLTGFKDPGVLDVLAASYAAAGRYGDAVTAVKRALEIHKAASDREAAAALQRRLERYQKGVP